MWICAGRGIASEMAAAVRMQATREAQPRVHGTAVRHKGKKDRLAGEVFIDDYVGVGPA